MRSFNADFETEMQKQNGAVPRNILVFDFDTPVSISDQDLPGGIVGLVKSWGYVDTSGGQVPGRSIVGLVEVPDLQTVISNTTGFSDHSTAADPLEGVLVTMYEWFEGTDYATKKEKIFVGVVRGHTSYTQYEITVTVKGIWYKYNRTIGSTLLVSEDDYPSCDPEAVGKMQNIVYGQVDGSPCLAISAGAVDNLVSSISSGQTTIPLVDASKFPTSGVGHIDEEYISWTGKSGNTLTGATRSWGTAPAAGHSAGAVFVEFTTYFYWQIAGHPVKAIDDVYVDGFLINEVVTVYTGQSGDEASGYPGQAIIRINSFISTTTAKNLLIANGMSSADATAAVAPFLGSAITISDAIALFNAVDVDQGDHDHPVGSAEVVVWNFDLATDIGAPTIPAIQSIIDGDLTVGAALYAIGQAGLFSVAQYKALSGTPSFFRFCTSVGNMPVGGSYTVSISGVGTMTVGAGDANSVKKSGWIAVGSSLDTWAEWNTTSSNLVVNATVAGQDLLEYWIEISVTPPSPSSPAEGVVLIKPSGVTKGVNKTTLGVRGGRVTRTGITNLTSNSVAEVEVGKLLTADCDGRPDDGSGTITGTPYALIERCDHVFEHLLITYASFPSAWIGASFATSGTFYNSNSYVFSLLISSPMMADDLLMRLSVQCRSRFFVSPSGIANLVVQQLGQTPVRTIPKEKIRVDSMSIQRSAQDDIVNTFNILFDKDNRLSGREAFRGSILKTDSASVARYQTSEPGNPSLFEFFAVSSAAMASDAGDFWLSFLKDSRKQPRFHAFLDNMDIEPGDVIGIIHPLDDMRGMAVEVIKIRNVLGSAKRNIADRVEILAVENKADLLANYFDIELGTSQTDGEIPILQVRLEPLAGDSLTDGDIVILEDYFFTIPAGDSLTDGDIVILADEYFNIQVGDSLTDGDIVILWDYYFTILAGDSLTDGEIVVFGFGVQAGDSLTDGEIVTIGSGDIYLTGRTGSGIYKSAGGVGDYAALGQTGVNWKGLAAGDPGEDVYACASGGDIYKQTGGAGAFNALSQTTRLWTDISINRSTGDVYACVQNGDIYKQTGGSGNFIALGETSRNWQGLDIDSSTDDVYACVQYDGIYKQTGGSGSFSRIAILAKLFRGIAYAPDDGDIYVCEYNGDIYKQTGGAGAFNALGQTTRFWNGITVHTKTGDVYACVYALDVFKQTVGSGDFVAIEADTATTSYDAISSQ